MSYILEALKRADAERERGAVPTLRSHAAPAAASSTARRPAARVWIAALAALVVVLLGALWWTLMRQPALVQVTAQAPAPVAVQPPASVVQPAPTPVEAARPVVRPATPKAPAPEARASATARATPPRPAISAVAAATAAPAAPAKPADIRVVFGLAELPDDIRQQLPKLAISGGTYSTQAAYRMLIVNGQVLHENDEPAPGLTLETIREKDVVLRFKGYRYSVGY